MAKFDQFKDDIFTCGGCTKTFKGSEIKLTTRSQNIHILTAEIFAIAKDGEIVKGLSDSLHKSDRTMSCPHCGYVHLFGFNKTDKKLHLVSENS